MNDEEYDNDGEDEDLEQQESLARVCEQIQEIYTDRG